jgi:hypothetical protein
MFQQLHPFGSPFFGSVTPFAVPFFPTPRISGVGVSVMGLRGEALDNSPALAPTTVEGVYQVIVQHLVRSENVPEFD